MRSAITTAAALLAFLCGSAAGGELPRHDVAGGVCVELGGTGVERTVALWRGGKFIVQRLERDASEVAELREVLVQRGLYGAISARVLRGDRLPYGDNVVNVIVSEEMHGVEQAELVRVLCPGGVAFVRDGEAYREVRKTWPDELDEWRHQWHGPDGALVSDDGALDVPTGVQWLAGPLFMTAGRKTSSQSFVSAGGRNFYVTQNVVENFDPEDGNRPNYLVARDAFNGVLLWKRKWKATLASGRGETNPRIVAAERRVFIVEDGEAVALDAATGRRVRGYKTSELPSKLLIEGRRLLVETHAGVRAFDPDTGRERWAFDGEGTYGTVASDERVYCLARARDVDGGRVHELVCLGLEDGKPQWRQPIEGADGLTLRIAFARGGVVALVDRGTFRAQAADSGEELWRRGTAARPGKPYSDARYVGHFYAGGLVWMRMNHTARVRSGQERWLALDPATGEVVRELTTRGAWPQTATPGKMGCQPLLALGDMIIFPRQATCVDLQSGDKRTFKFARGGCGLGAVPANGLMYVVPHACGCYSEAVRGLLALRSGDPRAPGHGAEPRLVRGPAYGNVELESAEPAADDWPTYRHDPQRRASTAAEMSDELKVLWTAPIADAELEAGRREWKLRVGPVISSPVVAGGRAYVSDAGGHRLVALDAATGDREWSFVADGRVVSPPTIYGGLCLFGASDGWTYCLRAADGAEVWRYRAAPRERQIVAYGQLESVWPAVGSVLVQQGLVYVAAGRAPDADGGVEVTALEPLTGRVVWSRTLSKGAHGVCDVPVGDGENVYVVNMRLDGKTGEAESAGSAFEVVRGGKAGLLEASWTRLPIALRKGIQTWTFGRSAGQLLAFSERETVGYRTTGSAGTLFCDGPRRWNAKIEAPAQVEALVRAGSHVFVAGPRDRSAREKGGALWTYRAADGLRTDTVLLEAPPVWDGMATAGGRLYVSTEAGTLVCLGSRSDDGE